LWQDSPSLREKVILETKCGIRFRGSPSSGSPIRYDFSYEHILRSVEGSLKRLQTDHVDILLLHNPPRQLMDGHITDQYAELEKLKGEGKLRAYGISLDWRVELEMMMNTTQSQAAEVFFNAFYQEPLPAFARAQKQGVGLIIKVPLDSGWLSGRYHANSKFEDIRKRWSAEVIARRGTLVEKFAELVPPGTSMAHAALQYCLAQPQVSTLIPGAKTVQQALDNFAAANQKLGREVVQSMQALWDNEIAANPLPW
jgi:aryl-alcohol dehydrogenase-like predicted oxidoreductase